MSRKRKWTGTAGAPSALGAPSAIGWRVREPVPKPLSTSLLGLGMFAGATLPFVVLSVAVIEGLLQVNLVPTLARQFTALPFLVQVLFLIWLYITPFFAGFILRGAIPRMYPRFVRWIPPVAVRMGIYSSVVVCAGLVLVVLQAAAPGWSYLLGLIPIFITVQLWTVLRLPELARVHAELDRVWL